MNTDRKKELKEAYANRHPVMGIVCWTCGECIWIAKSKDADADFNGTSFQLKLGSWPNREMQQAYKADPESFRWKILKELDYEDPNEDLTDDLELLYMEVVDEHPEAKPMRTGKR